MFRRLLTPLRLAFAGLALLVVAFVILVTQMSNQYLETPDVAHPLANLVKVPGGKQQHDGGGIYYVDVFLKRASLLESLLPAARPEGSDLIPRSSVVEPGITEQQRLKLLERENLELRRANEILRKASAYFAQAEVDRRGT